MEFKLGEDYPSMTEVRNREMTISLNTDSITNNLSPFTLSFKKFTQSTNGILSEGEPKLKINKKSAKITGVLENGYPIVKKMKGVKRIPKETIENILKPVYELAYIVFPDEGLQIGETFQRLYQVDYPVAGIGIVKTVQDKTLKLLDVNNNIAKLKIDTEVSGEFVMGEEKNTVTGSGHSYITLDIENQYFTLFEKNHTDVITFKIDGIEETIVSTDKSTNRTSIEIKSASR